MRFIFWILMMTGMICCGILAAGAGQEKEYVGSGSCRDCHEAEYERFVTFAKKAASFQNIKKMESKLTPDEFRSCFECHTTGYGQKGGFVSESATPEMKDPGCEVCHGPGNLHVSSGDPGDIQRKVQMETCTRCHNSDRIEAFDFKPLLYGGAH